MEGEGGRVAPPMQTTSPMTDLLTQHRRAADIIRNYRTCTTVRVDHNSWLRIIMGYDVAVVARAPLDSSSVVAAAMRSCGPHAVMSDPVTNWIITPLHAVSNAAYSIAYSC